MGSPESPVGRSKKRTRSSTTAAPPPSPSPSATRRFRNRECKSLLSKDFGPRKVLSGRSIDIDFFDKHSIPVRTWFETQKWSSILSLDLPIYPTLIREFFANLSFDKEKDPNTIHCFVKGVEFDLTPTILNTILDTVNGGESVNPTMNPNPPNYTPMTGLRFILNNPNLEKAVPVSGKDLTLEHRLLHHIITHNLLPRAGRFDAITQCHTFLIWALSTGYLIDLGFIIVRCIMSSYSQKNHALPYGMFFTKIFRHFKIKLKDEDKFPRDATIYGAVTLSNMGYSLVENVWTKSRQGISSPAPSTPGSNVGSPTSFRIASPGFASTSTGPSFPDVSSLTKQIASLDSLVQGPLLEGIAAINSKLINLNLNSSFSASDIPSSSHSTPLTPPAGLEQKVDFLISLVQSLHSQHLELKEDIAKIKLQQAQAIKAATECVENLVVAVMGIKHSNEETRQLFQQRMDADLGEQIRKFMVWFVQGWREAAPHWPRSRPPFH